MCRRNNLVLEISNQAVSFPLPKSRGSLIAILSTFKTTFQLWGNSASTFSCTTFMKPNHSWIQFAPSTSLALPSSVGSLRQATPHTLFSHLWQRLMMNSYVLNVIHL